MLHWNFISHSKLCSPCSSVQVLCDEGSSNSGAWAEFSSDSVSRDLLCCVLCFAGVLVACQVRKAKEAWTAWSPHQAFRSRYELGWSGISDVSQTDTKSPLHGLHLLYCKLLNCLWPAGQLKSQTASNLSQLYKNCFPSCCLQLCTVLAMYPPCSSSSMQSSGIGYPNFF